MAGWTNRIKYNALNWIYEGQEANVPSSFFMVLYTSETAPTQDANLIGDASEITAGNGYTAGGSELTAGTDFDSLTEDDNNDKAYVQIVDVTWTASGGSIPASGGAAAYAGLTDNNSTTANRELYHYWSLGDDYSVSDGQKITIQDAQIEIDES